MDLDHLTQSRMLALKLSTLEPEDYQWLQDHAPTETWQTLGPLVEEIRQLGFGLKYAELSELLTLSSKNDAAKQKTRHELINDLQWEELVRLFKNESESLLPLFSGLHDWQWKNSPKFVEYCKRRGHQFMDQLGDRPLLKEALLDIVGEALLSEAHITPHRSSARLKGLSASMKASIYRITARFKRTKPD